MCKFTGTAQFEFNGLIDIRDIRFDNELGILPAGNTIRIRNCLFYGPGSGTAIEMSPDDGWVLDCFFYGWDIGVKTDAKSRIVGNHFESCTTDIQAAGDNLRIEGNEGSSDILLSSTVNDSVIVGNVIGGDLYSTHNINDSMIADNFIDGQISFTAAALTNVTITGNRIDPFSTDSGMVLEGCARCIVNGNMVTSAGHGIDLEGDDCVIDANSIYQQAAGAADTYDLMRINGNRNMAEGNKFVPDASDTRSAVYVLGGECNMIVGNDLNDTDSYATDALIDAGANTQLFYPADATYGDNFTDCGTGS